MILKQVTKIRRGLGRSRFPRRITLLGWCLFLFLAKGAAAAPCLLTNGDFTTHVANNTTDNGWTTSNLGSVGWNASGGNPGAFFYLNNIGQLGSDPTAEQTVTGLTPGACYILSGDYASIVRNMTPLGAMSFAVDVNGNTVFTAPPTALSHWTSFTIAFTASGTDTIRLRAEVDPTDNDFGIDNICITPCCATQNGDFTTHVANNTTDNGWTTSNLGSVGWNATGGNPGAFFYLNNVGQLGSDPTAQQTVTGLTPGACYILSGDYASIVRNMSPPGAMSFAVDINGSTAFTAPPTAARSLWTPFAISFTASGTDTIRLRAETDPTDNDFGIDNICITPCCIGRVVENGDFATQVLSNTTDNGWTTSNLGTVGWTSTGGNPSTGPYFYLNNTGQSDTDPTAEQTVTGLTPGASYILSGDYASIVRNMSPAGAMSFGVDISNTSAPPFTALPTALSHWTPFAIPFTAHTPGTVTAKLRAEINQTDNDFGIDNICIVPVRSAPTSVGPPGVGNLLNARKLNVAGDLLSVDFVGSGCSAVDYELLYGRVDQLPHSYGGIYDLMGGECSSGGGSAITWNSPPVNPSEMIWFIVVAHDGQSTEGPWGENSGNIDRTGPGSSGASGICGQNKDLSNVCGQ